VTTTRRTDENLTTLPARRSLYARLRSPGVMTSIDTHDPTQRTAILYSVRFSSRYALTTLPDGQS
jgi:hypothetical protein